MATIGWSTILLGLNRRMARVLAAWCAAVFPRFCVGCDSEGSLLCRACDGAWHPQPSFPLLSKEGLGEVWSLARYADPVARSLLTAWKYHYDESAWQTLRRKLAPELPLLHLRTSVAGIDAIVPVPLSNKRRNERGFDQADAIATWLSSGIHLPVRHLLRRKLTFGHQADRTTNERSAAMAKSPFALRRLERPRAQSREELRDLMPRRVLMVDDVWTTGATMHAAALPLHKLGIETHFFSLLKSSPNQH